MDILFFVVAASIDAYVTALDGALRGPRSAKADLLTEVRDSLADAAAHHEEAGLDPRAAARLAVEEFGAVPELVPDYQRELALAQCRRTALFVALAVAAEGVVSELAWRRAAVGWTWQPDPFYSLLARTVDYAGYAVLITGLLAAVACGVGSRYVPVGRGFAKATGVAAIGVCAFFVVGGLVLSWLSPWHGAVSAATPIELLSAVVTGALPIWMVWSGLRCVRAASLA